MQWISERTAHIPGAEMISVSVASGGVPQRESHQGNPGGEHGPHRQGSKPCGWSGRARCRARSMSTFLTSRADRSGGVTVDRLRASPVGYDRISGRVQPRARLSTATTPLNSATVAQSIPFACIISPTSAIRHPTSRTSVISTKDGAPIYLNDVAAMPMHPRPHKIERKNRQRVVYVNANLARVSRWAM